jgi:pimeloyl-ACP methyl ester carboxylesterase
MGHSRGAVASLFLAVKRPELIRALVLLDPTILPFSWMGGWYLAKKLGLTKFVPIASRAARRRRVWPNQETMLRAYRAKRPFSKWKNGFLEAYISEGTEGTGDGRIRPCCDPDWESRCFAVCPHDAWRHVARLRHPTLLIYGARSDTFLRPAANRFRAKVPHAVCLGLDGTGHFVPMERPDEIVTVIKGFLKEYNVR